jgi:hypothetical protein
MEAHPASQKVAGIVYHACRSVAMHQIGPWQVRNRGAFNPLYAFSGA